MNRSRLLPVRMMLFALLATTLLAACTQDELAEQGTALPEGKYPLELTTASLGAVATPTTRATVDGEWTGNETVYVQIVSNKDANFTSEAAIDWANVTPIQYTVSSEGEMTLNESTEPRYWQSTDEMFYIRAWYAGTKGYEGIPVSGSSMSDADWQTSSTQSAETIAADDFLYAYKEQTFDNKANKTIEFRHLLSKLTINLVKTDYLETYAKEGVSVGLSGDWTLKGTFEDNGKDFSLCQSYNIVLTDITPYELASPTAGNNYYATYEALVIPQDIHKREIKVNVGKIRYTWPIKLLNLPELEHDLKGGYKYTFNITVKPTGLKVEVADGGIVWGTGGANGSGSVTLP